VVAGSNFVWLGDEAAGIGPITIDPDVQNSAIGRQLMTNVIEHAEAKGFSSIRLVQAAFHNRSLALYTKLGFNTVEPLSVMQGPAIDKEIDGLKVRKIEERDIDDADSVCRDVYGLSRKNEIAGAVQQGTGTVVENEGQVTGYSTSVAFFVHSDTSDEHERCSTRPLRGTALRAVENKLRSVNACWPQWTLPTGSPAQRRDW